MTGALQEIYDRLLARYGPQHWWPGETPFEVVVGAILTQNTSWANVERAISGLCAHSLLSPEAIQENCEQDLAVVIRACGYHNMKARRLKVFVDHLYRVHDGRLSHLLAMETDALRSELLSIWGIGEETADSIVLYAAGKPSFVVDAYTRRVFSRLGLCAPNEKYSPLRNTFMDNLATDTRLYNEYHALLVRHGKETCRKRLPRCQCCPLASLPCVSSGHESCS